MRRTFLKYPPASGHRGFTLIELLIVISIIAILAATMIPNFIGFDTEARVAASKANLDTLRTRIILFRAKEGYYPKSLNDLLEKTYTDAGIEKPYLKKLPLEMMSAKSGSSLFVDLKSKDRPGKRNGGWVYYTDKADVFINIDQPLDDTWGDIQGEIPLEW